MNQEQEFTKYEVARILGARALQISMDAPLLIKMEKEDMEIISYDPLKIAEKEFNSGVLPITVRRPLPVRKDVKLKRETEPEKEGEDAEKKEMQEEKEIKAEGEIMELSQPEDEIEEVAEEAEAEA